MQHFIIKARLILTVDEKVLLLAQTTKNGGKFTLPGGTVKSKEYAKATLLRECKEELGIKLAPDQVALIHVLHKKNGRDNRITLYFSASSYEGTLRARETDKFRGVTWCTIHRLPLKTSATVKHVLGQIRLGERYSEFTKKTGTALDKGGSNQWN